MASGTANCDCLTPKTVVSNSAQESFQSGAKHRTSSSTSTGLVPSRQGPDKRQVLKAVPFMARFNNPVFDIHFPIQAHFTNTHTEPLDEAGSASKHVLTQVQIQHCTSRATFPTRPQTENGSSVWRSHLCSETNTHNSSGEVEEKCFLKFCCPPKNKSEGLSTLRKSTSRSL